MDRLNGVIAFVRAAELRSFAAAGRQLGLSPSAVSKAVGRLEERLGARLMTRTTRAISLTDEGRRFLERASEALTALEEAELAVAQVSAAPRGRLRVDMPAAFGCLVVMPTLGAFRAAYPDLELEISLGNRVIDLVEDGIDLVVRIGTIPDSGLMARRLCTQNEVIVASPEYLERRGVPTSLADLELHELIQFRYPTSNRPHAWRLLGPSGAEERPVQSGISVNSGEGTVAAAAAGMGLAQVPTYMAQGRLDAGLLTTVLDAFKVEGPPIQALYASGRHLSPKIRVFIDHLVAICAGAPPWS